MSGRSDAIEAQTRAVRRAMRDRPTGLIRHTKRVAEEAARLAVRWDVDPRRATLAAWGHDLYRAHAPARLLAKARKANLPISAEEAEHPMLLHGPVAAHVLASRFDVSDEDVLAAVRDHTLGAPEMSLIAKILLLSDKFEPNKRARTPLMTPIRVTARRDIDLALLCWADWRWVQNRERAMASPPAFWAARSVWVPEHHRELRRTAPALEADDGWYEAAEALEPPPDRRTLEERRAARRARDENRAAVR